MKLHRLIAAILLLIATVIIVDALPMLYRRHQQRQIFNLGHFQFQSNSGEEQLDSIINQRLGCDSNGVFSQAECLREYRSTIHGFFNSRYAITAETAMFYSAIDKCPLVFNRCLRNINDLDQCHEAEKGCIETVRKLYWTDKNKSGAEPVSAPEDAGE